MLVINQKDILRAVTPEQIMDKVEEAMRFYEGQDFLMPVRSHLDYQGNTMLLMPCLTNDLYGTKLVTLCPDNPGRGLPVLDAQVFISHGQTGEALALINGRVLTALRTSAVGGVGIRHLSPPDVTRLGVVGAGVQGLHQAWFAGKARNLTSIMYLDIHPEKVGEMKEGLADKLPGVEILTAGSAEELLEHSQSIITCTTAETPVLPNDASLFEGKHFVGIGSYKPNMREFPEALFRLIPELYVDTDHAIEETGDLIDPLEAGWLQREQVKTLGSLLLTGGDTTEITKGATLFKSVGMALFDLAVGGLILEQAKKLGLGQEVEL
jgi:ornithine cyclodeaminase/alanine dehydrogenase-like protein (mu-crystallin family)